MITNGVDDTFSNFNIEDFLNASGYHHFHKDTEESYFRKILSNELDQVIDWSIKIGNQHLAITINLPICDNIIEQNTERFNYEVEQIKQILEKNLPTLTFFFLVPELNKLGKLHFHLLIGVRNFINYPYTLISNLLNVFKKDLYFFLKMSDYDVKIDFLKNLLDIKKFYIYIHKDMYFWKFPSKLFFVEKYASIFSECLGNSYLFYLQISVDWGKLNKNYLDDIYGVKTKNNIINQDIILNLVHYYLILNSIYLDDKNAYKKVEGFNISYSLIGTIKDILVVNFQKNIIGFFIQNFPVYFDGFDFNFLLNNFFLKYKNISNDIYLLTTNKIILDFSVLEFLDGVYFFKYNKFFKNNVIELNNLATLKYYYKNYSWARRSKPKIFIDALCHALDINPNECENDPNFLFICTYLASLLHPDYIKDKKSNLFILGKSNTGKTTLIVNILKNYFGKQNIGSVVSSKNFKWQDLIDKRVGVLDEARLDKNVIADFLKIAGGEYSVVEKKYSKNHKEIKRIPLVILSNLLISSGEDDIDNALKNRMHVIEFVNILSENHMKNHVNFKKILEKDESKIFLYFNKLFFKVSIKKYNNVPKKTF